MSSALYPFEVPKYVGKLVYNAREEMWGCAEEYHAPVNTPFLVVELTLSEFWGSCVRLLTPTGTFFHYSLIHSNVFWDLFTET
jgi:hypothetical protein